MKIAYGNSRMEKKWKNNDISWDDFCKRVSTTQTTTETVEEYRKMTKPQQDSIKDVGGFVGGHLRGGRRKTGTVLCRSMLTLDMDHGTPDVLDELSMFNSHEMCIYSTHKHTPEAPRLRLIMPLKRDVSEDEYPALDERQKRVAELLSCLSEDDRELVYLKYYQDKKNIEIAQLLDMNPSTVATRLRRALILIRSKAESDGTEAAKLSDG